MALALLGWMALSGAIHAAIADEADDAAVIRAVMMAEWNKPDASLAVAPIVVDGNHALASWTQGTRGGRALLRKSSGKWSVMLCSGDPLKHASALIDAGIPADASERLTRNLAMAESRLPTDQVALFSTFEGVMQMHEDQGHASHNGGQQH